MRTQLVPLGLLWLGTGVTAWLLWVERRLGRLLATVMLTLTIAGGGFVPGNQQPWVVTVIVAAAVALPCVWYFYRKPNVVAYYESLDDSSESSHSARSDG